MALSIYEKGDTIDIPVTFTDPNTGIEDPGVPDAMISIFKGNTQILAPTPLTHINGGKYTYSYLIPLNADSGVYAIYVTGTLTNGDPQTATLKFSVTDRLTNIKAKVDAIQLDIQSNKVDTDNQLADIQADIGDPSADGTTIHQGIKDIKDDLGNPLTTGQTVTDKLDDIRTVLGLGTPVGTVSVTGVIQDDNNQPIEGVRVVAIKHPEGTPADVAHSDAAGSYTLHLNPGTYILQFLKQQTILQQTLSITVPPLVTTFTVQTLSLLTKRTVTDVILNQTNQDPIDGVLVKAIYKANYDPEAAQNQVEAAAFTNTAGEFTLQLFPGIYIFEFIKVGFSTLPQEKTVF